MNPIDQVDELVAGLPPLVDASTLATLLGVTVDRIYTRRTKQRAGQSDALPVPLNIPGAKQLTFSRSAVREWFLNAQPSQNKRKAGPGRPKGSKNRRGIGRTALEGGAR